MTFKRSETSLEVAKKIQAKLVLGDVGFPEAQTVPKFSDYADTWLAGYATAALKWSTVENYQYELANHLKPRFGAKRLNEITRAEVKQFIYDSLAKGLAPATVRKFVAYLSSILNQALADEIIKENPTRRLFRLIPNKDRKSDINPLNREELRVFLDKARELYPRYYPFFLCAARTGMRLGELLALEWGAVDFNGRFIEVRQAMSRHRLTTPKNKKIRRVDMSQQLATVLAEHKLEMKKEALRKGRAMPERVFTRESGEPLTATTITSRVFNCCLERAGLRHVRFHDLRHSFASILIHDQKESMAYVKEQMGHHSIQMTVDLYGHLSPEGDKSAVDGLDDADYPAEGRNQSQLPRNHEKKAPEIRKLRSHGAGNGI
ncbi:MAG: tyrosine-type recombinase/integrase [Nitrospirota bacterium]